MNSHEEVDYRLKLSKGDESTYTLPWDIFNEEAASNALNSARLCRSAALKVVDQVIQWRSKEDEKASQE